MTENILLILIALLAVPCLTFRGQQLPDDIKPIHYKLDMVLDTMDKTNKYSGVVVIKVTCTKETNLITLHANLKQGLSIVEDSVKVRYCNIPEDAIVTKLSYDQKNRWMIIDTLDVTLIPWETYLIEIPFKGIISEQLLGLKKIKIERGFIIASDFKRTYARNVFPCFDEPQMRATFEVTIHSRMGDLPLSNGKYKLMHFKNANGLASNIFEVTPMMSTYQLAFIVVTRNLETDYDDISADYFDFWFYTVYGSKYFYEEMRDRIQYKWKQISESIISSLETFGRQNYLVWLFLDTEKYLNVETLGLVVKRGSKQYNKYVFYQNMEDFGNTFFCFYFAQQWESDLDRTREIGAAHSLMFTTEAVARNVFSSMVAPKNWDSQWLMHSQARFIAILDSDQVTKRNEILRKTLSVMKWDSLVGAKKLNDVIDTSTNSLEQEVSENVIDKGLVLINMICQTIGKKRCWKAFSEFYSSNINKAVSVEDFWNAIDKTLKHGKNMYCYSLCSDPEYTTFHNEAVLLFDFRTWPILKLTCVYCEALRSSPETSRTSRACTLDIFCSISKEEEKRASIPENVRTSKIMKSWITQEGYPVLTVKRRGNQAVVAQSRFYSEDEQKESAGLDCRWIPLTWMKQDDGTDKIDSTHPRGWLGCDFPIFPCSYVINVKPHHWIIFNNKMSGLYRVDYDQGSWKTIIGVLMDEKKYKNIHCENRVHLVSDVLALSLTGRHQTDFQAAFDLTSYLQHEQETSCLFVWESFFDGIDEYKKYLMKTPLYKDFENFLQGILKPVYETRFPSEVSVTGYIRKGVSVDNFAAQIRIHMESCQALVQKCLDHSTSIIQMWRETKYRFNSKLSLFAKGLTESVLCSALRNSQTTEIIDYVLDTLQSIGIENSNRDILSKSVSCLQYPLPLNRALSWCTENTINQVLKEKINIFKNLLGGTFTYKEAASYFFKNFERIKLYFSNQTPSPVPDFIKILACETDTDTVKMLKEFILQNGLEFMIKDDQITKCELDYERHQNWIKKIETSLRESIKSVGQKLTKNAKNM